MKFFFLLVASLFGAVCGDEIVAPVASSTECQANSLTDGWTDIGTYHDVLTSVKNMPDTPLLAVKGQRVVDLHISQLLGPFFNATANPLWVDMLSKHIEYPGTDASRSNYSVIHQTYNFPWPIQDRDFVLGRTVVVDAVAKRLAISYESVEDARIPLVEGKIRGHSTFTFWGFQCANYLPVESPAAGSHLSAPPLSTPQLSLVHPCDKVAVEVATIVDLKGSLPPFLVNQLQKQWPSQTINALLRVSVRNNSLPIAWLQGW